MYDCSVSSTIALRPSATVAQAAWKQRILFPSAFSPKTWVIVPVGSPPSVSMSSGLQRVGSFSMSAQPLHQVVAALGQPDRVERAVPLHVRPHYRKVTFALQPVDRLLNLLLGVLHREVGDDGTACRLLVSGGDLEDLLDEARVVLLRLRFLRRL